jgi:hypothetical protein
MRFSEPMRFEDLPEEDQALLREVDLWRVEPDGTERPYWGEGWEGPDFIVDTSESGEELWRRLPPREAT